MTVRPSFLALSVTGALMLMSAAAAAQTAYGGYAKETALELSRNHAGRYAGDPKEQAAADYMRERMRFNGLSAPAGQDFTFTARRGVLAGTVINSRNIVADKAGSGQTGRTLIVGAHYDSAPSSATLDRSQLQGLDDNSSGAGVLTELARNLSGIETEHNIRFVAFGAEEYGLLGSRHFAAQMSAEERRNALGMINLDSLVTGDKMYVNAGDRAYDIAAGRQVPAYTGLREHALAVARELGIELHVNPGDKNVPGTGAPYKPYGVGCCSDQEAFDEIGLQVAGFEATNWSLGPDFDGYTQTDNPNIPGGSTWHDPVEDNETFLGNALPAGRLDQRTHDFSRLITRLIAEQTNADVLQSVKTAAASQSVLNRYLRDSDTHARLPLFRRAAQLQAGSGGESPGRVWLDTNYRYRDADEAGSSNQLKLGVYGEYAVRPQWALGGGLRFEHSLGGGDGSIGKNHAYGIQAYSVFGAPEQPWWNTTVLGWSRHKADLNRRVVLGGGSLPVILDRSEAGSTKASVFSLSNELGYRIGNGEHLRHGPFWGLNYRHVSIDGYRSGADSRTALDIAKTGSDHLDTELGYQLQYRFSAAGKPVELYGRLSYVREFGDSGIDVRTVSRADARTRHASYAAGEDRSYGRVQLGIGSQFTSGLSAYLNADTTFARRDRDSAVHLGLQYRF